MARGELLFSVTAADCRFDYYRGSGKGGQKRNKTNSAVRCTHKDSGAVGQSDDTRSQHVNKRMAFNRMAHTNKFEVWHKLETAKHTGLAQQIEEAVDLMMADRFICIEGKDDGRWSKLATPVGLEPTSTRLEDGRSSV